MPLVTRPRTKKTEAEASVFISPPRGADVTHTENEEPQPQVLVAFGFLITNCAPSRPSE